MVTLTEPRKSNDLLRRDRWAKTDPQWRQRTRESQRLLLALDGENERS